MTSHLNPTAIDDSATQRLRNAYAVLGAELPAKVTRIDEAVDDLSRQCRDWPAMAGLPDVLTKSSTAQQITKTLGRCSEEAVIRTAARATLKEARPVLLEQVRHALYAGAADAFDGARSTFDELADVVARGAAAGISLKGFRDRTRLIDNTEALVQFDEVRAASVQLDKMHRAFCHLFEGYSQSRLLLVQSGALYYQVDRDAVAEVADTKAVDYEAALRLVLDQAAAAAAIGRNGGTWVALANIRGVKLGLQPITDELVADSESAYRRTARYVDYRTPFALAG